MNERTAAFLKEMGIAPLWVPRAAPQAAAPQPEQLPSGAPLTEGERIARMGWDELSQAIAATVQGAKPVLGTGARTARWVVIAGAASAEDQKAGEPMSGEAGKLLANMLAAAGLAAGDEVWITNIIKHRPATSSGADRAPTAEEVAASRPFVEREIALTGATTILTLGQVAANAMLGQPLSQPLSDVRGKVHEPVPGVRMVATLHPSDLLRRGQDKALAWADLCLAASDGPPA